MLRRAVRDLTGTWPTLLDLGLGVVELAPEHQRHAAAPQRVRDALVVAERAPLRHRCS